MRELVGYRFLLEQMIRRELRRKYKGSALGVAWYVVNPLVLMGAYYLMFGVVFDVVDYEDYPLFLMAGLVVWLFFSQALLGAAPAFIDQGALVRKARFPRATVPIAAVAVQLVTFLVVLVLVGVVTVAVRGTLAPALLVLPFVLAALALFVTGLALGASALHAYFRDVQPILSAALLPWFFVTPIFFEPDAITDRPWARAALAWANPVAPFVDAVREPLYAGAVPSAATLLYVAVAAALALAGGWAVYARLQGELAVVV